MIDPRWFCSPYNDGAHSAAWRKICRRRWRKSGDEMSRRSARISRSTRRQCREWGVTSKRETRAEIAAKLWPEAQ